VGKGMLEEILVYEAAAAPAPVMVKHIWPGLYGTSCAEKWDATTTPQCADAKGNPLAGAPDWCSAKWCYVDKAKCASNLTPTKTVLFPAAGELYWSADTCSGGTADANCSCIGNNDMIVGKGSDKGLVFTADDGERQIWPAAYGNDCSAKWDQGMLPLCADKHGTPLADRPDWCDANWCYINASKCDKTPTKTALFPQAGEVYWSSETCTNGVESTSCACIGNNQIVGKGMLEEILVYEAAAAPAPATNFYSQILTTACQESCEAPTTAVLNQCSTSTTPADLTSLVTALKPIVDFCDASEATQNCLIDIVKMSGMPECDIEDGGDVNATVCSAKCKPVFSHFVSTCTSANASFIEKTANITPDDLNMHLSSLRGILNQCSPATDPSPSATPTPTPTPPDEKDEEDEENEEDDGNTSGSGSGSGSGAAGP